VTHGGVKPNTDIGVGGGHPGRISVQIHRKEIMFIYVALKLIISTSSFLEKCHLEIIPIGEL